MMGVFGFSGSWRERRRKTTSIRPKIVCFTCTGEWMSRLQERVRRYLSPLFRGDEELVLDSATQELIAPWLAMTVMTGGWIDDRYPGWAIPEADRRELHRTGRPAQTMQVLIAPCSHDDRPPRATPRGVRYRRLRLDHINIALPNGVVLPQQPGYAATLSIKNLAALVFGHSYEARVQPLLWFDGPLGNALRQIWPAPTDALRWPSSHARSYQKFEDLLCVLEPWQ